MRTAGDGLLGNDYDKKAPGNRREIYSKANEADGWR